MLRAVIYARCSTEEESQKDALVNQVAEAKECVRQNGWILADTYIESKSGTSTKGRTEYNRLFEDLCKDKFDIVVIKSQDRLMRNTRDWYLFVDRLTVNLKKLYMYIEHKFYTPDDALIAGIKAILAEDYSRELSKKINNAHRNRQKHGGKPILTGRVYGLRKLSDGSYEKIPEEAAVKERMYELFAAGYGSRTVANILNDEGVVNRKGVPFTATNILRMVKNPLNKGTIVMNRKHYDFDTKRSFAVPAEEQYVYPDKIPAVVSEELWERANEQIRKRTAAKKTANAELIGRNPGKYSLSGKVVCGVCGEPFYCCMRRRYKDNEPIYDWKCRRYIEIGRASEKFARPQIRRVELESINGCDNVHLNEEKLYSLLEEVFENRYKVDKKKIMESMIKILHTVLKDRDIQPAIDSEIKRSEKLKNQMEILLEKLLDGVISDELYRKKQAQIEEQLRGVQEKIRELETQKAGESTMKERIIHIEKMMNEKKLFEQATVVGMLDEITKLEIFPEYMNIYFSYAKMLGIDAGDLPIDAGNEILKIEYGTFFDPRRQQKADLQEVVDYIKENPETTAKEMAAVMGMSVSGMQQRIFKLRKKNRIQFVGKGGKGYWEVLEE